MANEGSPISAPILIWINLGLESSFTLCNLLIIYMSIFHVKPSLCRTYALNHSAASTIHALLSFAVDFSDVTGIGRSFFFYNDHSFGGKYKWDSFALAVLLRYSSNAYRIFANIMVLLTYASYAYPFKFAKIIHKRNINYIFLFGHLLTFFVSGLMLPRAIYDVLLLDNLNVSGVDFMTYLFYCEKLFSFIAFGTMAFLYVLAIRVILKHHKNQHSIAKGKRRSQLVAVLIYCTPPNFFLALGLPRSFCIITRTANILNGESYEAVCVAFKYLHHTISYVRFFCASICTLIAFHDYRQLILNAFRSLVPKKFKSTPVTNFPAAATSSVSSVLFIKH
ncbi:hypothetical protein QR680_006147 [Steinernema hermaphroditum]|uniref:Uncharacterized protein n=1 Tax=Steinernema hermaphroditum TaxID=289476 RepID=A0AA39HVL5_9BILA|nr:hypothetical protein QR680_006147 [Steinernema hermaphroditum]